MNLVPDTIENDLARSVHTWHRHVGTNIRFFCSNRFCSDKPTSQIGISTPRQTILCAHFRIITQFWARTRWTLAKKQRLTARSPKFTFDLDDGQKNNYNKHRSESILTCDPTTIHHHTFSKIVAYTANATKTSLNKSRNCGCRQQQHSIWFRRAHKLQSCDRECSKCFIGAL